MSALVEYVPRPAEWMADALCAQIGNPEIFFPHKGGSAREAKAVCARCPAAAECLEHSLTLPERFGIWGGVSEQGRRALAPHKWGPADDGDNEHDTSQQGNAA